MNFFIPIIALIVVTIVCGNSVVHGIIAAIVIQFILYLAQRLMTLGEFMNTMFEGITSMAGPVSYTHLEIPVPEQGICRKGGISFTITV